MRTVKQDLTVEPFGRAEPLEVETMPRPDAYHTAAATRIDSLDHITVIRLATRLLAACARNGCPHEGQRYCEAEPVREPGRCTNCWLRSVVAVGCE